MKRTFKKLNNFNRVKTIIGIIVFTTAVILTSCEGPMGPPGFDGLDGDSLIGSIFEIEGDFHSSNDYTLYFEFPNDFLIYDTDVVLVYILWEIADTDGGTIDVWRLLPQTIVLDEGVLQYNFDYTVSDVQIFLDGTIPFNTLLPAETDDQIFRIAVLPADFALNSDIDIGNLNSIMQSPHIKMNTIIELAGKDSLK